MRVEVELPGVGENNGDEATVSFWYIEEDEEVEEGEDIVEMITEKQLLTSLPQYREDW